ncbi:MULTISPECIES: LTA synthase family protein [Bacillus]|uniref:LTA synthase family protein n=1 Tax=Bacillus TaxID=1386 RepID=UPI001CD3AB0F|nr:MULTISPECIES: LTA synthase family protein [Bacillus]MCA1036217.1 LTA synthase family protein [Bacillus infantis]MDT0159941.1 LTA synthase family protein [Bacillus sp. AG4(2022)]
MGNKRWPALNLIGFAVAVLWLKTYIAYKTSFDIKIENFKQEIILLINPLSFLMFVLGFGLFLKKKNQVRYVVISSFIISAILFANVVFYRFFNDFLTVPVLFQTSNMSDLGSSVSELLNLTDLLYFADFIILAIIMMFRPQALVYREHSQKNRRAFFLAAVAIAFFNLGLAETERPQLLTRTFDREMLVKNIGTYNYHIYDVFLQSKSSAQRALADGSELADIGNYARASYVAPADDMFGIAKGKNVILISMESTQNFVINEKVNGQEITPFLNDFIKESYYFNNFYHQTAQGKTSDSEFLVDNSLYPLSRGAVFFTHSGNEFAAAPEILNQNGYYTASLHANNKSFWNRDIMYDSFGYQRFYSLPDYEVTETNSVGWGMKDIDFFEQSIQHLKEMPEPYYAKFITLTNHFPFELGEEDQFIEPYTSGNKTVDNYFPTVRYTDEAIKNFIQKLKDEGIYEDSIIILYGDHYGISENHNKAMGEFLGTEVTPFVSTQLQRVPLIIHIPGQEGKTISKVSGQIDIKPTILHLLGIDTRDDIDFGSDLFANDRQEFTVLRDGSFITKDYIYTRDTCYSKETAEPADAAACEPYIEKAKNELEYSDKIIYGDLLRFYEDSPYIKQKGDN